MPINLDNIVEFIFTSPDENITVVIESVEICEGKMCNCILAYRIGRIEL